ncbi:hypothetical protein H8D36_05405 [archaeon]|nr:hypothetical protein [archaeon]
MRPISEDIKYLSQPSSIAWKLLEPVMERSETGIKHVLWSVAVGTTLGFVAGENEPIPKLIFAGSQGTAEFFNHKKRNMLKKKYKTSIGDMVCEGAQTTIESYIGIDAGYNLGIILRKVVDNYI